jgi:hypothetical protein
MIPDSRQICDLVREEYGLSSWYGPVAVPPIVTGCAPSRVVAKRIASSPRLAPIALVLSVLLLTMAPAYASPCASECDVEHDVTIDGAGRILVAGGTAGPAGHSHVDRLPGLYLAL